MLRHTLSALACGLCLCSTSQAGIFDLDASMNGITEQRSFDSLQDGIDLYQQQNLSQLFGGAYTGSEAVSSTLNVRGLPVNLAFPTTGSSTLVFTIPVLGINESFTGSTRDASVDLWEDYLKHNPDLLERMMKKMVEVSPVDPVAGNPNSMMSRGVVADSQAMWGGSGNGWREGGNNRVGIGVSYARMLSSARGDAKEMDSDTLTLPLEYSHQFAEPNHELLISMPLTYTEADNSKIYDGKLGIFYRRPLQDNWVVSVAGSFYATGSPDLLTASYMASAAIASSYVWSGTDWSLTMGNFIGYYTALRTSYDGTSINPGIANTVFRNGLLYSTLSNWVVDGDPLFWECYAVNTYFTGTDLFTQYQNDIGITIGTRRPMHSKEADYRLGLSYTFGSDVQAFKFNFGTWF
ncbi:hypothetical protein [Chitinilyticum aquatile]|uniref:hypothetical protein n=1 Tax=Chitinilyticum aquatile TaxID=362520 RepID=UPI0003F9724C|nr:hypothetical protein [Chitinilyticum aquatile]